MTASGGRPPLPEDLRRRVEDSLEMRRYGVGFVKVEDLREVFEGWAHDLAAARADFARIEDKLEAGTMHCMVCNDDHDSKVGRVGGICCCPPGKEIKALRADLAAARGPQALQNPNERIVEDDEIVCTGDFHIERMDDDHIWFAITVRGERRAFDLIATRNRKLSWTAQEGWAALARAGAAHKEAP